MRIQILKSFLLWSKKQLKVSYTTWSYLRECLRARGWRDRTFFFFFLHLKFSRYEKIEEVFCFHFSLIAIKRLASLLKKKICITQGAPSFLGTTCEGVSSVLLAAFSEGVAWHLAAVGPCGRRWAMCGGAAVSRWGVLARDGWTDVGQKPKDGPLWAYFLRPHKGP